MIMIRNYEEYKYEQNSNIRFYREIIQIFILEWYLLLFPWIFQYKNFI